jgi:Na+/melibiose symporter-like transporter
MAGESTASSRRSLERGERRIVALLGVPTLGLALAVTVVTTYLPVVAQGFGASNVIIGVIIGAEGFIALWLPLVAGIWSDRLDTRLGGRLPFLLGATPLIVAGLAAMALVSSIVTLAAASLVFFAGYFLAYEPYRALYPDALGEEIAGRAQGAQALFRGAGTGCALLAGGLLLSAGQGAPFLAAAGVFVAAIAAFSYGLARRGIPERAREGEDLRDQVRAIFDLLRGDAALRAFLVANALWELSLAALKTFVVLYVTRGLGFSLTDAALIIGSVALLILAAAGVGGRLADRFGALHVLGLALPVYAVGLVVPFVTSSHVVVAAATPFIAIGGGVLMALPYAVLMPLMPETAHGALTGCYSLSRGLGTWLGPLLGGVAITVLAGDFAATDGYQAVWGVCAAAALASVLPLRRLAARVGD